MDDNEAMIEGSAYLSLAVWTHLLLGTPHSHAIVMEEVFAVETDAGLASLEFVSTD